MKIKFLDDCELEVVTNYDESNDIVDAENETFQAGIVFEVDLVGEDEDSCDLQFGDGSVAYSVPTNLFEVVEQ